MLEFFAVDPVSLDAVLVPWVKKLISGNIVTITAVYAVVKYIAVKTPWAWDDSILSVVTGIPAAIKAALAKRKAEKPPGA